MLTYGSVCSGIEAVSVAWRGLMRPLWFSEIEPFPCAVLAHHYPDSPRYKAIGNSMATPVIKWIGERMINYIGDDTR